MRAGFGVDDLNTVVMEVQDWEVHHDLLAAAVIEILQSDVFVQVEFFQDACDEPLDPALAQQTAHNDSLPELPPVLHIQRLHDFIDLEWRVVDYMLGEPKVLFREVD